MFSKARLIAAESYIQANRSDPFCRARTMTHMRNGVAGFTADGKDAFYSAEPYLEERRTPLGEVYQTTAYKNLCRP